MTDSILAKLFRVQTKKDINDNNIDHKTIDISDRCADEKIKRRRFRSTLRHVYTGTSIPWLPEPRTCIKIINEHDPKDIIVRLGWSAYVETTQNNNMFILHFSLGHADRFIRTYPFLARYLDLHQMKIKYKIRNDVDHIPYCIELYEQLAIAGYVPNINNFDENIYDYGNFHIKNNELIYSIMCHRNQCRTEDTPIGKITYCYEK